MRTYQIAVIAGDGIGREVVPAAQVVLDRAAACFGFAIQYDYKPWSSDYYFAHGRMAPADYLDQLRAADAILLGAVGHPKLPDHVTLNGLLLPIRRKFDQFANVRPARLYEGVPSPLALRKGEAIDMVVVRENTEGEYSQVGGFVYHEQPDEVAIQTSVFTRRGTERIIRYAFDLARTRRRRLCSVTKSNAQAYGMVLWDRVFSAVAEEYGDVATESLLVDAAAMNFVRRPESFDVVVASNLFGDILSDLSAILVGSMGMAASANIDPTRRFPSMFEPVHGSAPDIAGKGLANPIATILCCAQMLEHLGEGSAAKAVHDAVEVVLREGRVLTPDLGGDGRTEQVGDAVSARVAT